MNDRAQARRHDRRTRRRGLAAEAAASLLLAAKGYRVLDRRYRTPHGEIDLVVRRGNVVAFVEVKARSSLAGGLAAVTERQRQRIVRAALAWMARGAPGDWDYRFDVVVFATGALPRHLEGAFTADGF